MVVTAQASAGGGGGGLLQDWRRVNVAITRAKTKLVIVGCATALRRNHLFSQMIDIVESRGWIIPLPVRAHLLTGMPVGI